MQSGSSGLLPQPGGFAGFVFLVVPVDLDARYQTVLVKCPNGPGDDVQLDPAGRPSGGDELSAQDRPACDDNGLKCFEHLLLKRIWLHPTSQALGTPVRGLIPWRNEHDVAMDQGEGTVEVLAATANGFQPATCGLHVLLRHRLLRKAGGFEGFLFIEEQADAGNLAVLEAHRLEDRAVQREVPPRGVEMHVEQDKDLIARKQHTVQMNLHRSKHLVEVSKVRGGGLGPAIDAAIGHARGVMPLKIVAPERPCGIQATRVPCRVVATHDLAILLRHRPRSISRRSTAFHAKQRSTEPSCGALGTTGTLGSRSARLPELVGATGFELQRRRFARPMSLDALVPARASRSG